MNAWRRELVLLWGWLLLVVAAGPAGADSVVRGPYLQMGSSDSMVLRWRTDLPGNSRVRYGLAPDQLTHSTTDDIWRPATEHAVTLTGLQPETRYFYAVGTTSQILAGGDREHSFVTAPVPGSRTPTRVWVIGDSGTADDNARAVRDAYREFNGGGSTEVWLMLGDNAYTDGTDDEYQAAVFEMYPAMLRQVVLWPTLGNHDGRSADSATQSGPYYEIFSLPTAGEAGGLASGTEAYYSFDYANIHFICLDSHQSDRSVGGAMLTWLEGDLAATDKDWIIAFWHHPPYSKGSHNSDVEQRLVDMRTNVLPILESYGVDLVLSGHSHSYERSHLLDGHYGTSDSLDAATMILDAGGGREKGAGAYRKSAAVAAPNDGAVYTVAGSSGKISGGSLDHPAMFISLNSLGSLVLDVTGPRLDARFIDSSGDVRDEFTIQKGRTAMVPQVIKAEGSDVP